MSEMIKIEAEDPGGLSLVPNVPEASTSELEQKHDSKDLMFPVQPMFLIKDVPHDWSSSLDHQSPEPSNIKEEDEEPWISQEEEQLTVKSEEEKPRLSELHHIKIEDNRETDAPTSSSAEQMETEPDEEDFGGQEPDRIPDPVCSSHQSKMTIHKRENIILTSVGTATALVLFKKGTDMEKGGRILSSKSAIHEDRENEETVIEWNQNFGPSFRQKKNRKYRMSEMLKVEAEDPGGLSLMPLIPAASTSELEQNQESKDLMLPGYQMLVIKEEVTQQNPQPPCIKKEEEELWISQEEEQLAVKSEDEEKPQSLEPYHIKPEDTRETEAPSSSLAGQMETVPDGQGRNHLFVAFVVKGFIDMEI
ncbi:hypothetical protein CRENBAI_011223 [Crenichthys baileyi]|uniref:Uncharacterized protein n=1 Tax=Crenichthys baileyi TaxID=28760 RepID=A0AAV9QTC8_9TELE